MVLELTVIPRGGEASTSTQIAALVKPIEASGLEYQMTAFGTLIEGSWDEVMEVARRCHEEARRSSSRVLTLMRVDDYEGRTNEIHDAVQRVERKLGRPLRK